MVTMSIINPTVHMLGDNAACIAYTRFAQYLDRYGINVIDLPEQYTPEHRGWLFRWIYYNSNDAAINKSRKSAIASSNSSLKLNSYGFWAPWFSNQDPCRSAGVL